MAKTVKRKILVDHDKDGNPVPAYYEVRDVPAPLPNVAKLEAKALEAARKAQGIIKEAEAAADTVILAKAEVELAKEAHAKAKKGLLDMLTEGDVEDGIYDEDGDEFED